MPRVVRIVSGPDLAAGLIPEGFEPIWRVPDQDAYYCVPSDIAASIRLEERWSAEKAGFTRELEEMYAGLRPADDPEDGKGRE
jgi:hypothetical protein